MTKAELSRSWYALLSRSVYRLLAKRIRTMTIQFAGSSSTGDRRRRRLAVNGDGSDVDSSLLDGDAGTIESQLVASAAAAPWVPVSELRIWIYASIIGLMLAGLTFVLARPIPFRPALTPLADHLLAGSRPVMVVFVQTAFLVLSTQLSMLISWYRSQCKLDFAGRYRVWPWAVGLFSLGAFCEATDIHLIFGQLIARNESFSWRGETVAWLLPFCVAALPISILVDRDVRNNRSSLVTLRLSGLLWLTAACFEIYQTEFSSFAWFGLVRQLVPMYASSALFLGLWLQARIVAYVCPDPPEIEERSAGATVLAAAVWLVGCLKFRKRAQALTTTEEEEESKPKRRRKKAEEPTDSEEPTTVKRKRKAPAKKATTTRTRSRIKPVEIEETEESEESTDESAYEESEPVNEYAEDSSAESLEETSSADEPVEEQEPQAEEQEEQYEQESWEEEPVEPVNPRASAAKSNGNGRFTQVDQPQKFKVPAPHVRPAEPEEQASNPYETSNDESDEDRQFQLDSGMSPDQMKGLSKRQKRELKKQLRDQQRLRQ